MQVEVENIAVSAQKKLEFWYNNLSSVREKTLSKAILQNSINTWAEQNRDKIELKFIRLSEVTVHNWITGRTAIKLWAVPIVEEFLKKNQK